MRCHAAGGAEGIVEGAQSCLAMPADTEFCDSLPVIAAAAEAVPAGCVRTDWRWAYSAAEYVVEVRLVYPGGGGAFLDAVLFLLRSCWALGVSKMGLDPSVSVGACLCAVCKQELQYRYMRTESFSGDCCACDLFYTWWDTVDV